MKQGMMSRRHRPGCQLETAYVQHNLPRRQTVNSHFQPSQTSRDFQEVTNCTVHQYKRELMDSRSVGRLCQPYCPVPTNPCKSMFLWNPLDPSSRDIPQSRLHDQLQNFC